MVKKLRDTTTGVIFKDDLGDDIILNGETSLYSADGRTTVYDENTDGQRRKRIGGYNGVLEVFEV